jgi:hypothetical protein
MDDKEYLKFVKGSPVFNNFSEDFKNRVLNAKGEDMGRYAKMLENANSAISAAQADFTERNESVLLTFKEGMRKTEKDKNELVESRVRKEENASGENLLEELKKIN